MNINSEIKMTPNMARKISYDAHSATEPERASKKQNKQIINIRDYRLE